MNKTEQEILLSTLVVIPTYNNVTTLKDVINEVLVYAKNVLVVNDGSTDGTNDILKEYKDTIIVLDNTINKGKGFSIRKAMNYSVSNGYLYMITLDSDGQHFAKDIPKFIKDISDNGDALIVGARDMESENVPSKSSFGNKFSNFWYWAETGDKLSDTQSGYRLYPVDLMKGITFFTNRFEFEVEVLIRSNWNDIVVKTIPVNIFYAEGDKRITHFKPSVDFTRISVLNTVLFSIAMLYIHPRNLYRYFKENSLISIIKNIFTKNNETPNKIAMAMGLGVFMGIIPIWGFQMLVAGSLAHFFKLNKTLVILVSNISIAPVIPFIIYLSYQTGFFMYHGNFDSLDNILNVITQITDNGIIDSFKVLGEGLLVYVVGSIVFAIISAVVFWLATHIIIFIKDQFFNGKLA